MKVPAISLTHDVPVDAEHVSALMENIKANGQYSAILVRKLTHDIIDGFHRVAAMQLLGMDVEIDEKDMNDEEFLAARIVSATQHEGVKVGRAVTWIDEEWANLPFSQQHKGAAAAFSAASKGKASKEVTAWVEKQSAMWGAAVNTIRSTWMYERSEKKSTDVDPIETPTVQKSTVKGDKPLDSPESLPFKLRNAWADAKLFINEAGKINEEDMADLPDEHHDMLSSVLEVLLSEVNRLNGYL